MELNYYNTFITVAADCPSETGIAPPDKKTGKTKPGIEFELAADAPYAYTQEELLYAVYVRHKDIPAEELAARDAEIRAAFFAKPQPCLRASMLAKKYGWGIHFDERGKLALVAVESPAYREFLEGQRPEVKLVPAMRNKRA
ncbi:hypothetical protein B5M42_014360 [Paenibacillus athensensis]|uniref:Uncharacterized protein n=1 Tax=Paenibacillus athensensis TaxID=1967502 RepID=A0A4Y8Q8T5_9BACL|nr:DUF6157 family protein [Paenibacillus athensensis]MCD1259997.1 hypothetical protein [Paenibacillus athensensis]